MNQTDSQFTMNKSIIHLQLKYSNWEFPALRNLPKFTSWCNSLKWDPNP